MSTRKRYTKAETNQNNKKTYIYCIQKIRTFIQMNNMFKTFILPPNIETTTYVSPPSHAV